MPGRMKARREKEENMEQNRATQIMEQGYA
jgi:hypothetical protein